MEWLEQDVSNCSIGRAVGTIGQPWVLLVLRDAFRGVRRFKDLQDHLGVSRSVLSARLDQLVEEGLLERRPYREDGQRQRLEYLLTDKGRDLYPVVAALRQWGDKYLADTAGPASLTEHRHCGAPVRVALVCREGHVLESEREVTRRPGPSARAHTRAAAPS